MSPKLSLLKTPNNHVLNCDLCVGEIKQACEASYRREAIKFSGLVDMMVEYAEAKGKEVSIKTSTRDVTLGTLEFITSQIGCQLTPEEIEMKFDIELGNV